MRDKNQAIQLAIRMTNKDRVQYYVVENKDCSCLDIVTKIGINGRTIIYPVKHDIKT